MEYAKNDNVLRRQLNVAQKIKVESNYIEWARKTRQENKKATQAKEGEQVGDRRVSIDTDLKGATRELLAEKVGTSPATAQRAMYVMDNAPKEIEQQMLTGDLSISGAAKKTRKIIKNEPTSRRDSDF